MIFAWVLSALALLAGVGLGVRALIDPKWAARFARLKADEQGGGFAEFRATYGGAFAFSHLVALIMTGAYLLGGEYVIGVAATGAGAALAAAWGGACIGRLISMWRDEDTRTRFNRLSAGVEFALSLAIGMPWLVWALA